jgi:extracellular factor (EF) 3-hydroxypalmitic acid methyl ester biosynthesis protein
MSSHQIDSLVKFTNSQQTGATGTLVQITRNSIVMEVYNPYSIVQLSEVLSDLRIRREERIIYQGRAVVSTLVNTGLYLVVSATLVDPWQDLSGIEHDGIGIKEEAERFISDWEASYKLEPSFQLTVTEIRSLLLELNRWLEHVDLFSKDDGITHSHESSKALFEELKTTFAPILQEKFQLFEHEASKIPHELINSHRKFAQRDLHPLLLRSPFIWRSFTKPLGYAGDYEMVKMMIRDPNEGPTSYSQLMNALFLATGPALAHRNRIDILCERLTSQINLAKEEGRVFKVLNIGCGPAVELQRLIKEGVIDDQCNFTLLDFNEETLQYTKSQMDELSRGKNIKITYIHKSVHDLLIEAIRDIEDDGESYDMVYCAGLFDYLADKVCSRLIRLLYKQTKESGITLLTNVHPNNPVTNTMEYLLEWHLKYRDEEGMEKLLDEPYKHTVYVDKSTVNVFMELSK